jgi:hypothetical protein
VAGGWLYANTQSILLELAFGDQSQLALAAEVRHRQVIGGGALFQVLLMWECPQCGHRPALEYLELHGFTFEKLNAGRKPSSNMTGVAMLLALGHGRMPKEDALQFETVGTSEEVEDELGMLNELDEFIEMTLEDEDES